LNRWAEAAVAENIDSSEGLHSLYANEGGVRAAFSGKVADYVASRPNYPDALFDALGTHCGLRHGARIADVGAGTGLLSQGLLQRGWNVSAIEPNPAMRAAADHFCGGYAGYGSLDGCAEAMPLVAASVELVSAAQAFHWFNVDAARAECLRVLEPDGQVALIWNDRLRDDALHNALDSVFAEFGGAKRGAMLAQDDRADVPRFFGAGTPRHWTWPHEHSLDANGLASLAFSRSYMPARDSDAGRAVVRRIARLFEDFAVGGAVAVRYTTLASVGRPR
jgi:SAM-dependent methyltransferase